MIVITNSTPPLQSGDRLTREEFHARYEALPRVKKAELIEGEVFMGSPVQFHHGDQHAKMIAWASHYTLLATPGTVTTDNTTIVLDDENELQPDIAVYILPETGRGQLQRNQGYLVGAPELVIEIANSTSSNDLGRKKRVYQSHGVREYLVWSVQDNTFHWFINSNGKWKPLEADRDRIHKSGVFPGLWLDIAAMQHEDYQRVFEVLRAGISTPEHEEFLRYLGYFRSNPSG